MTTLKPTNDDFDEFDSPWKNAIEHAFPEFMAFFFPTAYAQIDWARGHEFKNTELRQVVREAELGKRFADELIRVTLVNGKEHLIYIHIEVQSEHDAEFAQRMFTYNYRLYDRYACPIASMAVLADLSENWKPDRFGFELLGCTHEIRFPVVKLLELASSIEDLGSNPNPFALVTAAHLQTKRTKHNSQARYTAKKALIRMLYQHCWSPQRVLDFFRVLDWMMHLPEGLAQKLKQDIDQIEGETKMQYVTSVERLAKKEGMQIGKIEGKIEGKLEGKIEGEIKGQSKTLARLLIKRFGPLSPETAQRLQIATAEQLEYWTDRILDAPTPAAVFAGH